MAYAVTKTRFPVDIGLALTTAVSQAQTLTDNVDNGPTELLHAYVVNDAYNSLVYGMFWDDTDPVVQTDPPAFQFPVAASDDRSWYFKNCKVTKGLSFGVSKTGGTACATPPVTPPDVHIITSGGE